MTGAGVIVMAKEPLPGRVKTRLCPPCTPDQAAALARAALADTLEAVLGAREPAWVTVALDGMPGPWLHDAVSTVTQRGDGFDERLARACEDAGMPALVMGADTPQLTAELVDAALIELAGAGCDAVLGPADDGGYWCIGFGPELLPTAAFGGIPTSRADTGSRQLARLRALGLQVSVLAALRDVDTIADARAVAAMAPKTRFARMLDEIDASALAPPR